MLGLSTLGIIHTAMSLIAIVCGILALIRDKEISAQNTIGRTYLIATLITAATALGIFRHGGFNVGHGLAILTLLALTVGYAASLKAAASRPARYVQTISFTTTLLFHMIPGFTEALTRLPLNKPTFPSPEAPEFGRIYGALFLVYLIILVLQIRRLRAETK